jgi:hypothetical protein
MKHSPMGLTGSSAIAVVSISDIAKFNIHSLYGNYVISGRGIWNLAVAQVYIVVQLALPLYQLCSFTNLQQ